MVDVFISYSRRDIEFAQKLHHELVSIRRDVWIDWEDIPPLADWRQEIETGIEESDSFVFVISPDSAASRECQIEIEHACKFNKRLVPVVYRDTDPEAVHPSLSSLNWIFFRPTDDFKTSFEKLLNALATDLEYVQTHRRLLMRANDWEKHNRDDSFLLRGKDRHDAERWLTQAEQKEPPPTPLHTQYILASGKAELAQQRAQIQRQRIGLGITSIALVIAASLAVVAYNQRQQAERREIEALAASAEANFALNRTFASLLTALRAATRLEQRGWSDSHPELRASVLTALQQPVYRIREFNRLELDNYVNQTTFSPDGSHILTTTVGQPPSTFGDWQKTIQLWQTDGTPVSLTEAIESPIQSAVSPDHQAIAHLSQDGILKIWDFRGQLITTIQEQNATLTNFSFSPTNQAVATLDDQGTVKLWTLNGQATTTFKSEGSPYVSFNINATGDSMMTFAEDGSAKLWTADGNAISTFQPGSNSYVNLEFSPDGKLLVKQNSNGTVDLLQSNGTAIATLNHQSASATESLNSQSGAFLSPSVLYGTGVYFSPDSQVIAIADPSGATVNLWQPDGTLIATVQHPQNFPVTHVAFSPDGKTIATTDSNYLIRLWRMDGTLVAALGDETNSPISIPYFDPYSNQNNSFFSPNGEMIATIDAPNNVVRLWTSNGEAIATLRGHEGDLMDVSFSPDGKTIATASQDKTARLWQVDGSPIVTLRGHSDWVREVNFSPDGQVIATTSDDGSVRFWKSTNPLLTTLPINPQASDPIPAIAFSPDDQITAITTAEGEVRLQSGEGNLITTLSQRTLGGPPNSVHFGLNSKAFLTVVPSGPTRLWSSDGHLIATLTEVTHPTGWVQISPDQRLIAVTDENNHIRIWQLKLDGNLIHSGDFQTVEFAPDSRHIVTISLDNEIQLWQADGKLIKTLVPKRDLPQDAALDVITFSPNGNFLVLNLADGSQQLWKMDGTLIATPAQSDNTSAEPSDASLKPPDWITAEFNSGEDSFITNSTRGLVQLWRTDGSLVKTLAQPSSQAAPNPDEVPSLVATATFSPAGQFIFLTLPDTSVQLWRSDGNLVETIYQPDPSTNRNLRQEFPFTSTIVFSTDDQLLAATLPDQSVQLWRTDGTLVAHLLQDNKKFLGRVEFIPNAQILMTHQNNGAIQLWNADGEQLATLLDNTSAPVSYSPDNSVIVVVDGKSVKLWQRDGTPIADLDQHTANVEDVKFSPDGQFIATGSWDSTVKLWDREGNFITSFTDHTSGVETLEFSPKGTMLYSYSRSRAVVAHNLQSLTDLNFLREKSCDWLKDYLFTSSNVSQNDRHLCDDVLEGSGEWKNLNNLYLLLPNLLPGT